jgi:lipopolysaccharide biosynthesis protein
VTEPTKVIAFFLPQFHPVAENDAWWGAGFTDWTNVVKARPLFDGHYQPHVPGQLGFYDLRVPEVREQQAAMAAHHGIDGFMYYHYWFGGRRVLDRTFDEVLRTGRPDFPFCLCWANENWTRVWDGGESAILLEQRHDADEQTETHHLARPSIHRSALHPCSGPTGLRDLPCSIAPRRTRLH